MTDILISGGYVVERSPAGRSGLEHVWIVGDSAEVLIDGGVRRGGDILKALALGARAVLVGRPYWWGLAAGGARGVSGVIDVFRAELDMAMALSGRPTVDSVGRDLLFPDP